MPTDITHLEDTQPFDSGDSNAIDNAAFLSASDHGFPIDVSRRFSYVKRLGRGGNALVYQAFDNVLERHVALKFLLNSQRSNHTRLVAEARAQANVEHPNICPIYEVIETDNSVYLVMQFIEGESLQSLSITLNLEQVLLLLKNSAVGLHTAHMQGMIHRDFKPANVMVSLATGNMEVKIVDFGLATQSIGEGENESTSNLAGTTGFISPEQYNSNFTKIDRSSDIYSLGASLLYCLTGKLLTVEKIATGVKNDFIGKCDSIVDLLAKTNLPKDVQIIIAKSMAVEPEKRYQSALELANDIGRYLEGEPIQARASKAYWLGRKLVKHKWLAAAAFTIIAGMLGMYIKQLYQQKQQEQQQVVREQGLLQINNKVKELEYQAQLIYMSPRHNIEAQRQQWLDDAIILEYQLSDVNPILLGATHYGIGRIYQVLGNDFKAVEHLEQAHLLENIEDTAFYLAVSYSNLYHQQLTVLSNIASKNARESRIRQLDKKYKTPAITLLNEHIESAPYRSYANALLTYYQRDWDAAMDILNEGEDLPIWYYPDDVLKGDILLAKANALNSSGRNIDLIEPLVHQAAVHYQNANAIAPSDPSLVLKQVSAINSELTMFTNAGKPAESNLIDKAQQLRSNVLDITNIDGDVYHTFGLLYLSYALNLHYNNGIPQKWLDLAESELTNAYSYTTEMGDIWLSFARLYSNKIKLLTELNIDNSDSIKKAIEALGKVSDKAKDYYYFNELGTLNRYRALESRGEGNDGKALFEASIFNYIEANKRSPERVGSLINAASTIMLMAKNDSVDDRYRALEKAESILLKVVKKEAEHFAANYYLTVIYFELYQLSLYQDLLVEDAQRKRIGTKAAEQMAQTKSINNTLPYVLDLEQVIKQLDYEQVFQNSGLWNDDFDKLLEARDKLAKTFAQNTVVTSNYIGLLSWVTGIRVQLGLPAEDYIAKLEQALNDYPEFENVEAYRALAKLFSHWNTPDIGKLNLIDDFKLRDKRSPAHDWALAMVLITTAKTQKEIEEAIQLLNDNKGILPVYREMIIKWANEKVF